ncbi:MAG: lipid-A-disaccharide synthase [Pseudomonadota bacterium]
MTTSPLKIAIVAGERSGEKLACGIVDEVASVTGTMPELCGVGGPDLRFRGLNSLFDADEIALMGFVEVAKRLPRLVRRISQTARHIVDENPDVLLLVDSPDFSLRVAKKVREADPSIKIVKYVSPTVWAWRPERAAKMAKFVDHVLALFPFEPSVMRELVGPDTTYVGHPLIFDEALMAVREARRQRREPRPDDGINLVCLPGSRSWEISKLIDDMGATVEALISRGNRLTITIPTLPKHVDMIRRETAAWRASVDITVDREGQMAAYLEADVALCASGTVTLELALAQVPAVSIYRTDAAIRVFFHLVQAWSAALPNIIGDKPIIPEFYDHLIRPGMLARHLEGLGHSQSTTRRSVIEGYDLVLERMQVAEPPEALAVSTILDVIGK